ncbi:tetratricopeptide repeat protein [Streptomyces microflavus]
MHVHLDGTGDATTVGSGVTNSGYIQNLTVQQHPLREPASWPHQVGVIPPTARSFQHRVEADRLHRTAEIGGTTVLTQLLTGMGGVGKTQLAADYARTAWGSGLDVLVWVTASDRSQIVAGYAQAGVELCRADPNDAESAARALLAWLTPKSGAEPCRWLVVLDDVADPADLRGLWPPDNPAGRTLVTTRRRDAALTADGRRTVEVGLFAPAEARAYLTSSLAGCDCTDSVDDLTALAKDLGHLPLALAQAAAYLFDTGDTVAAYRGLLADRTRTLADASPDALPDDQTLRLDAVWSLSVERADTLRPVGLARPLLQLASLLDSNGIPQDVLTSEPALGYLAASRARLLRAPDEEPAPVAERDAIHAARVLHRLSLVEHSPATPHQAVRVHQLIQRATWDDPIPWERDETAYTAADALMAAWPEIERDVDLSQALRSNTTALVACAENALYRPDAHAVLFRAGLSLGDTGQVAAAGDYFQHLVSVTTRNLGPDHPDTLTSRSNLAGWRGEAGDAAGAAEAFADLLTDRLRILGPDHPDTLHTRSNLASWRGEAGDAAGAAEAFADLLTDHLRIQGPDHPDTLHTRSNLASWRGDSGDAAGAAEAFADLLTDRLRILGTDHPDTLHTRSNLAGWRGEAGDAAGAAEAFADLLTDRLRILGPDHPDTLHTRSNLASWRGDSGDAAGAAEAFADLLTDRLRILGPDHPDTLQTRGNLAGWRGDSGDAAGAADAFADLLTDRLRILGPDHPDTLTSRSNLAIMRGRVGDAAGAAEAFAALLTDRLRILGPDHPDTLHTRGNLADWRGEVGDAAGAAEAFADLLTDQLRILGPDHPDTLHTRSNLADWRGEVGDAAGAAEAFADLLTDQLRILGPDHPHTLYTRSNLAGLRGRAGDAAGAAQANKQLFAAQGRLLGKSHPETLAAWGSYAHWLGQSGDALGAAVENEQLLEQLVRVVGDEHPHVQVIRHNIAHWRTQSDEGGAEALPSSG